MHRPQSTAQSTPTVQFWLRTHGWPTLVLAVLYFLFGHASFLVQVDDVLVTPVLFAPEGIALAMALRFGAAVWPGIFAGQLLLALSLGLAPWPAASISAVNSLEAVLAVGLFRRLKLDVRLPRARDLAGLLLLVFFVLQPFSATFGNAALWAAGIITSPGELALSWADWWIGNALAQMLVAPLLLTLFAGERGKRQTAGDFIVPLLVLGPALLAAHYLVQLTALSSLIVVFAPLLLLLAIYRGMVAVCVGALVIALGLLYATSHAFGPFVTAGMANIPDLNLFIIGLALSGQFLAAFLRQAKEQQIIAEELRSTRAQLQRTAFELTENIPVGTYTMVQPPDGGLAYFSFLSTRFLEMTGLEREEAQKNPMNAFACVHPEDHEEWVRKNAYVFEHKLPFKEECRVIVKGETRWITAESTPRNLPDGSVVWEGVLTDITDRKLAEQKVAASEARLRKILDNIPVPVAIADAVKDGPISFLNEAFTRTFGYTPEDLPDVGAWARLACPDEAYRAATFQTWDAAVAEAARTNGTVAPMEFRVRAKDGSFRDVLINAAALENMLLVGFVDITARKKAEEQVAAAHRDMQLTASAARLGFWELDVATGLDHWDEEMARIHGIRLADFDGHWETFVHPDDHDEVMRETRRMLESGAIFGTEYRLRRPSGEVRHVRERGIVTRDEKGRALKVNGVLQDITEEKEADRREKTLEEQYRRDLETKLKTSLTAAAVAHEINQPLSGILLQSRMALQQGTEEGEALRVIAREAQRVVKTIDKMKTLLRSVQTNQRLIDLAGVVQSALLYNKGLLARHRITVRTAGLEHPCRIKGDDAQLQLALTNLLRNAAEAITEAKTMKREIAVGLVSPGDHVELVIGDSGPGWPDGGPAEVPLSTTKKAGTGIGLYVVRTAMENHRGEIVFGRSPMGGAEVRLRFPSAEKH
jgi:PAS domain S-box-containing protein